MFDSLKEKIEDTFSTYINIIRLKILGKNNKNLDFVVDSFYKLPTQQRTFVLSGLGVVIVGLIFGVLAIYFERSNQFDSDLDSSLIAYNQMQTMKIEDQVAKERVDSVVTMIQKKNSSLKIKPFFEKISERNKIEIQNIMVKDIFNSSTDPFFKKVKEVSVEMKIQKVSIPALFNFLVDVEKSKYFVRVKDLRITGIHGTKLYFDTRVSFRTYQMSS